MTLQEVETALAARESAAAIIELGSTATGRQPWSDIDLLVALDAGPDLAVEFHVIDDRPADIVFTTIAALLAGRHGDLQGWLAAGRIAFCRSLEVERAVAAARATPSAASDEERYFRWVELNVNLVKLRRYAEADDPEYRAAIDLLLDAAFAAAPRDALVLAGRRWSGERDALRWLAARQPEIIELLQAGRAGEPAARLAAYERIAAAVAEPAGGLWPPRETTGGWLLDQAGTSRWTRLLAGS
ncbi:MAG: hypothetical protein OEV40_27585 [Acidimicrobiia bacterium]|nr:hypothetical protein [Acidimicrobiia bacterium]